MIFISHDLGSVAGLTDRIVVMRRGEIVEIGTTRSVINNPRHPYTQLLVGSAPTLALGAGRR
jgi:ABC-type dipeptide/oligopeptide/nickel transport system ATPase component